MKLIKFLINITVIVLVLLVGITTYNKYLDKKYLDETNNMTKQDFDIVNSVISIAKEKIGLEYVWGGKGEIMTEERLDELIGYYGDKYYPLDKQKYIGIQAFDCSGLTYYTYLQVTGIQIGYSTTQQKEVLRDFKVEFKDIQPGDLIYTPGHVVMYIGRGRVVQSKSKAPYPLGGVCETSVRYYKSGEVYRPIEYVKTVKGVQ